MHEMLFRDTVDDVVGLLQGSRRATGDTKLLLNPCPTQNRSYCAVFVASSFAVPKSSNLAFTVVEQFHKYLVDSSLEYVNRWRPTEIPTHKIV
jgi:hypothetical protein